MAKSARTIRTLSIGLGLLAGVVAAAPSQAQEFFKGKQVTIVVGFSAGGGYDLTARLYARHYGRLIPGNPTVIVSNMPGAGSAVATATVANSPPQDGTRLGFIAGGAVLEPLLSGKNPLRRANVPLDRRAGERAERLRHLARGAGADNAGCHDA